MADTDAEPELPDDIYDKVAILSEEGNEKFDDDDFAGAIDLWQSALKILPEPKHIWESSLWLHASIGDAWRKLEDNDKALHSFTMAHRSADGHTHPFVLFSLGITLYDLGNLEGAEDYLLRAYMIDGSRMFENEDPKYFQLLKDKKYIK